MKNRKRLIKTIVLSALSLSVMAVMILFPAHVKKESIEIPVMTKRSHDWVEFIAPAPAPYIEGMIYGTTNVDKCECKFVHVVDVEEE